MNLYTIVYHARNFHGLARLLAPALHCEEVDTPRLNKPPRGKHVREAEFVRGAYLHQFNLSGGRLSQRQFIRMLGVSPTIWNRWVDGHGRMRSDSIEKVAKYAPPGLPRPLSAIADERLDPNNGEAYAPSGGKPVRGYMVRTNEDATIAGWIDRIENDQARAEALAACLAELRANPRGVAAGNGPDRPTRK